MLRRLVQTRVPPATRWAPAVFTRSYSMQTGKSTVNVEEIKKFSAKADEWWDPNGEFGMLHLMNPERVNYVRQQLHVTEGVAPFKGLRMLDIGCGGGLLSESLARLGGTVVGADAGYANIQMAKYHARQDPRLFSGPGSLDYRNTTAEDLNAAGESFDVVLAMEIIEHVDNPMDFLRTCANMVRPGGYLFLSTMSRTLFAYLATVFLAEHVLGLVHTGTHDWKKYIYSNELDEAIQSLGPDWQVKDMRGITWNPILRKWKVAEKPGQRAPCGLDVLEINYLVSAQKQPASEPCSN